MLLSAGLSTLAQLALASLAFSQHLNKPAAWPNLDHLRDTLNSLPGATYKIDPWVNGYISEGCRDRAMLGKKDPTKFQSYTVYMGDCNIPWTVCQEEGAEPSIEKLVDTLARVPIGMRQYIGDIVHFSGGGGGSAWKIPCIVHVSGNSAQSVGVWLHEASHCVDGANGMGLKSRDPSWLDAYNLDTHVADRYAQVSHAENFAQYASLVIYDRFTNRKLQWHPQYMQVVWQIRRIAAAADSFVGNWMFDYSGKRVCTFRPEASPVVNPATGAIMSRRSYITPRNTGITILTPSEGQGDVPISNCTLKEGSF
ncbi:hypothetical protein F5X68DRAFT_227303 [Plectosphaerella plurivora]|uniref:Uncharacterized protein n=1 Tax=Plectosphaerella plurivora TaxID=936078 RepID=A0A9P8VKR1_9PEZI|nr:hypothetical protein F5X68DRAFT_227303 [Plectosphaerella plurivora]